MYAYQYEYYPRQTAATEPTARQIIIQQTSTDHAEGMSWLSEAAYNYGGYSRVDEFISRVHIFPEGQFIALDVTRPNAPQVVGFTSAMRMQWNPAAALLKPWAEETGYG